MGKCARELANENGFLRGAAMTEGERERWALEGRRGGYSIGKQPYPHALCWSPQSKEPLSGPFETERGSNELLKYGLFARVNHRTADK